MQIKCILHTLPNHAEKRREILIAHGAQTRYDIVHATQIVFFFNLNIVNIWMHHDSITYKANKLVLCAAARKQRGDK